MKIKTLQADSVSELDGMMATYLENGWGILGDLGHYRYKRQHAVHGYDVWETKFTQRMMKSE